MTKLKPDGSDRLRPEDHKGKITLGRIDGYPIVLTPPNDLLGLVIAEGVETALTVALDTGCGAWASGGVANMAALVDKVPDYIEAVTIHAEDDKPEPSTELARRLVARGFEVKMMLAPKEIAA